MRIGKKQRTCVYIAILLSVIIASIAVNTLVVYADSSDEPLEIQYGVPTIKRVTCYLPTGNKTCSGTVPKANYSIGADRRLIGCMVAFYKVNEDGSLGDFVTMGMVEDTGSHKRIRNGNSFDIFQDSMADAKQFVKENGDYLYCVIIPGKG